MNKNKRLIIIVILTLFACFFSACAADFQMKQSDDDAVERDPVLERFDDSVSSVVFYFESVDDVVKHELINNIFVGEVLQPGTYMQTDSSQTVVTDGKAVTLVTSSGAEASVRVEQVLKGDQSLVGQTITVGEALTANDKGEFNSIYFADTSMKRAVFCTYKSPDVNVYVCTVAEWQIYPLDEDGTLRIWPYLDGARACSTLKSFASMVVDTMATVEKVSNADKYAQVDAQTLAYITDFLNEPLNNGFVRQNFGNGVVVNRREMLRGGAGLPVEEASEEEIEAYRAAVGKTETVSGLIKMSDVDFRWFMTDYLNLHESLYPTDWIYLEAYNAWFSEDTTCTPREVTCVSGTYNKITMNNLIINYTYEQNGKVLTGVIHMSPRAIKGQDSSDNIVITSFLDWDFRVTSNQLGK